MNVYSTALSIALTAMVTVSLNASFAESEAGNSASSQASTMNNSQESRQTATQSQSSRETAASQDQNSEARTVNETENNRESSGSIKVPPAPAVPGGNQLRDKRPISSNAGTTNAILPKKAAVAHVPHMVTHNYRWRNYGSRTRLASRTYMTRTVQQAARTR